MKKIRFAICALIAALALGLVPPAAMAIDDPGIDTTYAAVLLAEDGDQETVLYTKNADERLYPASLTKVMTVLLAVEDIESGKIALSDPVTAQPGFDFDMIVGGSSVYIMQQETMTLESLLYCAMVASANDACNVIAQYVSGSISDFVARMNARAAELGCTGTNFTNTHGLPDANHYTTAWDFSRIVREAAKHELFMTIASTINYTVPDTNVSSERVLESTNSLVNPTNPLYPGDWGYEYAKGIKTGHTNDAGYCLASSAEKDGVKLTVRWLTYPSRQELPLLAESAQASLKEIGIDVDINCTANRREFLADMGSWDIYASALVTAPSGDPQYFFTTSCVPGMSYNFGAYDNPEVTALIEQLSREFDPAKRGEMAVTLQQMILDDNAYVFCSFLQMNMISKENVQNYTAHACDYYQVTADLDIT